MSFSGLWLVVRLRQPLRFGGSCCRMAWLAELGCCSCRPWLGLGRVCRHGADCRGLRRRRLGLTSPGASAFGASKPLAPRDLRAGLSRRLARVACPLSAPRRPALRPSARRRFRLSYAQRFRVVGVLALPCVSSMRILGLDIALSTMVDNAPARLLDLALVDVIRDGEGLAASRARDGKRHPKIRVHGSARSLAPNLWVPAAGSSSKRGANSFSSSRAAGYFERAISARLSGAII